VVRTETGCIPSLPPGTDLLAAGGHKTRPYDFGGILGVTTNLTGRTFSISGCERQRKIFFFSSPQEKFLFSSIINIQFSIFNIQ
jgi:hypothetical protein